MARDSVLFIMSLVSGSLPVSVAFNKSTKGKKFCDSLSALVQAWPWCASEVFRSPGRCCIRLRDECRRSITMQVGDKARFPDAVP